MSLLSWLEGEKIFPKVYWNGWAGVGGKEVEGKLPPSIGKPYFAVFSSPETGEVWKKFPAPYFFSPEQLHREVSQKTKKQRSPFPLLLSRVDHPNRHLWTQEVLSILQAIDRGDVEKIVLARESRLEYAGEINPYDVLSHLREQNPQAISFLWQLEPGVAFLGASPEKLYRRKGTSIEVEALAGTTSLGRKEKKWLLEDEKERREFAYVKRFVETRLRSVGIEGTWRGEDVVKQAGLVQHLHNSFIGTSCSLEDQALVSLLHPTPAIAGFPQEAAMTYLDRFESCERGWYASPSGLLFPGEAEVAIGIRSALIDHNVMHLFAGAGIVKGSDPMREWEELERKISLYDRLLTS